MLTLTRTLDPVFRALADSTRRWTLECLLEGDMRLLEVQELFPMSPSTLLYHLRLLEQNGLLVSCKEGPMRLYSLRREGLQEAAKWLRGMVR